MPCQYCGFACYVPIPKDAPPELVWHLEGANVRLATCLSGMQADSDGFLSVNYGEIMLKMQAREDRISLDRLLDRQSRAQDAIQHLFGCQFDESVEFLCDGCVAAHKLLNEISDAGAVRVACLSNTQ